jgi:DNA-binding transcriptional regulator YiaG
VRWWNLFLITVRVANEKKSEISVALRGWRRRHKLSQTQAALKLKVSPRTFQEWEQGRATPHHLALAALREKIAR